MTDLEQSNEPFVCNTGYTPRKAPVRDAILQLADGTRTAAQIASILGISKNNVRVRAHAMGIAGMLRPAGGSPIAAHLPTEVVLRDLVLPHEVTLWLIGQMARGATVQDLLRGIVTDAYHDETRL